MAYANVASELANRGDSLQEAGNTPDRDGHRWRSTGNSPLHDRPPLSPSPPHGNCFSPRSEASGSPSMGESPASLSGGFQKNLHLSPSSSPSGRLPARLDGCVGSGRSSNPSEVSEDFRSDWGVLSPLYSARSGTCAAGQSLEVSASIDAEALGRGGGCHSLGSIPALTPYAQGGVTCPTVDEDVLSAFKLPPPASLSVSKTAASSWLYLRCELEALSKAFEGVRAVRERQSEYLRRLKSGM